MYTHTQIHMVAFIQTHTHLKIERNNTKKHTHTRTIFQQELRKHVGPSYQRTCNFWFSLCAAFGFGNPRQDTWRAFSFIKKFSRIFTRYEMLYALNCSAVSPYYAGPLPNATWTTLNIVYFTATATATAATAAAAYTLFVSFSEKSHISLVRIFTKQHKHLTLNIKRHKIAFSAKQK